MNPAGDRALRTAALAGNVVYVLGLLVAVVVLLSLGPAPWRAYANSLLVVLLIATALGLNVTIARTASVVRPVSALAILLNVVCLVYVATRPEYATPALRPLLALAPALQILLAARSWRSGVRERRPG